MTTKDYPYKARDGKCTFSADKVVVPKISQGVVVPSNNNDQLLAAVEKTPVNVAVDATRWSSYSSGIFSNCGTNLNHEVVAIGYGTEGGKDFWLVRNSWASGWGEDGHIRLLRTSGISPGTCGIANDAMYPIL